MPRPAQVDAPVREFCRRGVHLIGQPRLGKNQVQPHQQDAVLREIIRVLGTFRRELRQNPLNLQLFFRGQFSQFIVGLYRGHRLDKECHSGSRDVMHQPRHRAFVICAYRQHIAVGAHGDDRLLQRFGIRRRGEDLVEGLPGSCGGRPHLAADVRKIGRCAVGDLVLGRNRGIDPLFQILVGPQRVEKAVDAGLLGLFLGEIGFAESCAACQSRDVQQFPRVQRSAELGPLKRGTDVPRSGKGRASPKRHQPRGIARLRQAAPDFLRIRRGLQLPCGCFSQLGLGLSRQHFQNSRQFQRDI